MRGREGLESVRCRRLTSRLWALFASAGLLAAAAVLSGATPAGGADRPARVGIYYFGGWSGDLSHSLFAGLPRGNHAGRQPLYGWLDKTTHTMRSQLYWAGRTGIDFFNFLWYYRPELAEAPFLNKALANYVALKDHQGVGFAITYTNGAPVVIPRGEWRAIAEQWVTRYFSHPDYLRIAGKPVLFVLEGNSFFEQLGGDPFGNQSSGDAAVNAALEELRQIARAHGLPGVFVVAGRHTPWNFDYEYFPEPFVGQSWDAVTQFAYPALAGEAPGEYPFSLLANAARAMWDRIGARSVHPYIPSVTVGWDPRPWQQRVDFDLYRRWFTRSPDEVGALVRDAIAWAGRNARHRLDAGPPLVFLSAWNELGEGAYLIPTKQDGFAYARAVASALGLSWNPEKRPLALRIRGSGSVSVGGSSCRRSCTRTFDEGLVAVLRARPARGQRFAGWSGACSGQTRECAILMDRARIASARFVRSR